METRGRWDYLWEIAVQSRQGWKGDNRQRRERWMVVAAESKKYYSSSWGWNGVEEKKEIGATRSEKI